MGTYLLTAGCGSNTEDLTGSAPTISFQPAAVSTSLCGDVEFSVQAEGSTPLAYQWSRDGSPIAGATEPTLQVIAATQLEDGASFTVTVSNRWGALTSLPAALTVGGASTPGSSPEVLQDSGANQVTLSNGTAAWTSMAGVSIAPDVCGRPARLVYQRTYAGEYPDAVVLRPDGVAWTDSGLGRVLWASLAGEPPVVLSVTGGRGFWDLAVAQDQLYWPAGLYGIGTVSLFGGPTTTIETGPPGEMQTTGVAVDSEYVYWNDLFQQSVNRMPLGGGPVTVLASGQGYMAGLATDGRYVYWASTDETTTPPTGRVSRVDRLGGGLVVLAVQPSYPLNIAADQTHVFWTSEDLKSSSIAGSGAVNRVPIDGSEPFTVLVAGINPYGVAVNATHVYWTEPGGSAVGPGRVARIPK